MTNKTAKTCEEQATERTSALVALQNMDPNAALAPLKTLFASRDKCSGLIRRQAISLLAANGVLAANNSDAMNDLIVHIAATDPDAEVRSSAYAMLSQIPTSASIEVLSGVLMGAPDDARRQEALTALASNKSSAARKVIHDFVLNDSGPEEIRGAAIEALAHPTYAQAYMMGTPSVDEMSRLTEILKENGSLLRDIYPKLRSEGLKKSLLNGLISLGGPDNKKMVLDVIASKSEPLDMRRELFNNVISNLGDQGSETQPRPFATVDDLAGVYDRMSDRQMRESLVGLFASHSTENLAFEKLASIARSDKDKELRRVAIEGLANSKNAKAAAVLSDIVNQQH
jgi:hypothetical protein